MWLDLERRYFRTVVDAGANPVTGSLVRNFMNIKDIKIDQEGMDDINRLITAELDRPFLFIDVRLHASFQKCTVYTSLDNSIF